MKKMVHVCSGIFILFHLITEPINGIKIASELNNEGCIELFYINNSGILYHRLQIEPNGSWSNEELISNSVKSVLLARGPDDLLELFYISSNNDLYHRKQLAASLDWLQWVFSGKEYNTLI
jgi:hypothetical protein